MSCVFDTTEGASVIFTASVNNRFGSQAESFVEEPSGEITLVGFGEGTWSETAFSVLIPVVVPETERPAGEAVVSGTFSPSSPAQVEDVRHRDGNAWTFGTVTFTELGFDITEVMVPGYTVLLESGDCDGSLTVFDVKMTDPASTVLSSAELESDGCALEGLPDAAVRVRGNLRELRFEVVGFGDGGRAVATVRMRAGTGTTTVDVIDRLGEKITDLTITITLSAAGASEQERFREHGFLYRVTVTPYVAQIEVSTGDGQHGVVDCEASYVVERVIDTPPGEDAGH